MADKSKATNKGEITTIIPLYKDPTTAPTPQEFFLQPGVMEADLDLVYQTFKKLYGDKYNVPGPNTFKLKYKRFLEDKGKIDYVPSDKKERAEFVKARESISKVPMVKTNQKAKQYKDINNYGDIAVQSIGAGLQGLASLGAPLASLLVGKTPQELTGASETSQMVMNRLLRTVRGLTDDLGHGLVGPFLPGAKEYDSAKLKIRSYLEDMHHIPQDAPDFPLTRQDFIDIRETYKRFKDKDSKMPDELAMKQAIDGALSGRILEYHKTTPTQRMGYQGTAEFLNLLASGQTLPLKFGKAAQKGFRAGKESVKAIQSGMAVKTQQQKLIEVAEQLKAGKISGEKASEKASKLIDDLSNVKSAGSQAKQIANREAGKLVIDDILRNALPEMGITASKEGSPEDIGLAGIAAGGLTGLGSGASALLNKRMKALGRLSKDLDTLETRVKQGTDYEGKVKSLKDQVDEFKKVADYPETKLNDYIKSLKKEYGDAAIDVAKKDLEALAKGDLAGLSKSGVVADLDAAIKGKRPTTKGPIKPTGQKAPNKLANKIGIAEDLEALSKNKGAASTTLAPNKLAAKISAEDAKVTKQAEFETKGKKQESIKGFEKQISELGVAIQRKQSYITSSTGRVKPQKLADEQRVLNDLMEQKRVASEKLESARLARDNKKLAGSLVQKDTSQKTKRLAKGLTQPAEDGKYYNTPQVTNKKVATNLVDSSGKLKRKPLSEKDPALAKAIRAELDDIMKSKFVADNAEDYYKAALDTDVNIKPGEAEIVDLAMKMSNDMTQNKSSWAKAAGKIKKELGYGEGKLTPAQQDYLNKIYDKADDIAEGKYEIPVDEIKPTKIEQDITTNKNKKPKGRGQSGKVLFYGGATKKSNSPAAKKARKSADLIYDSIMKAYGKELKKVRKPLDKNISESGSLALKLNSVLKNVTPPQEILKENEDVFTTFRNADATKADLSHTINSKVYEWYDKLTMEHITNIENYIIGSKLIPDEIKPIVSEMKRYLEDTRQTLIRTLVETKQVTSSITKVEDEYALKFRGKVINDPFLNSRVKEKNAARKNLSKVMKDTESTAQDIKDAQDRVNRASRLVDYTKDRVMKQEMMKNWGIKDYFPHIFKSGAFPMAVGTKNGKGYFYGYASSEAEVRKRLKDALEDEAFLKEHNIKKEDLVRGHLILNADEYQKLVNTKELTFEQLNNKSYVDVDNFVYDAQPNFVQRDFFIPQSNKPKKNLGNVHKREGSFGYMRDKENLEALRYYLLKTHSWVEDTKAMYHAERLSKQNSPEFQAFVKVFSDHYKGKIYNDESALQGTYNKAVKWLKNSIRKNEELADMSHTNATIDAGLSILGLKQHIIDNIKYANEKSYAKLTAGLRKTQVMLKLGSRLMAMVVQMGMLVTNVAPNLGIKRTLRGAQLLANVVFNPQANKKIMNALYNYGVFGQRLDVGDAAGVGLNTKHMQRTMAQAHILKSTMHNITTYFRNIDKIATSQGKSVKGVVVSDALEKVYTLMTSLVFAGDKIPRAISFLDEVEQNLIKAGKSLNDIPNMSDKQLKPIFAKADLQAIDLNYLYDPNYALLRLRSPTARVLTQFMNFPVFHTLRMVRALNGALNTGSKGVAQTIASGITGDKVGFEAGMEKLSRSKPELAMLIASFTMFGYSGIPFMADVANYAFGASNWVPESDNSFLDLAYKTTRYGASAYLFGDMSYNAYIGLSTFLNPQDLPNGETAIDLLGISPTVSDALLIFKEGYGGVKSFFTKDTYKNPEQIGYEIVTKIFPASRQGSSDRTLGGLGNASIEARIRATIARGKLDTRDRAKLGRSVYEYFYAQGMEDTKKMEAAREDIIEFWQEYLKEDPTLTQKELERKSIESAYTVWRSNHTWEITDVKHAFHDYYKKRLKGEEATKEKIKLVEVIKKAREKSEIPDHILDKQMFRTIKQTYPDIYHTWEELFGSSKTMI